MNDPINQERQLLTALPALVAGSLRWSGGSKPRGTEQARGTIIISIASTSSPVGVPGSIVGFQRATFSLWMPAQYAARSQLMHVRWPR